MNVQQIEYVLAVSKLKNFGKAAESCFITQSTLSTMVAKFEQEIDITIFDRKTKPITVTKEGEKVIDQLRIISHELENLGEVVQGLKGELVGKLTVGAIPTVAPYLFPYFLKDFISAYPKIRFEISEIPTEKIVNTILRRELDIGIVSIPLHHEDLIEIPLYEEPFFLYDKASSDTRKRVVLERIDLERLWLLEEGHCIRNQIERICNLKQQRLINGNLIYKSGTIDTLMKFVRENNGITLLPKLATLQLSKSDLTHIKQFSKPTPVRQIGLIVHKHFVKKKILRLLESAIKEKVIPALGKMKDIKIVDP